MAFEFVRFTETDTPFAARVTIRRTGQIGFNTGALNRFQIKNANYAVLYFDAKSQAVGIELTDQVVPGAIEIKKSPANTYLRSKNFCDRFGIEYASSRRFELKKDLESNLLYFELGRELESEAGSDDESSDDETIEEPEQIPPTL